MSIVENLIQRLKDEKEDNIKGGIYNKLQVDFAYNSNHIEGSKLSHDQTRYIFETHTVGTEPIRVDDVIETVNHFRCFDYILDFHARYEKIHPFYDGNGRTGRLIIFKQCLDNDIVPFIIEDKFKGEYNRGLYEWQSGREKGYLRDTCRFMQDYMNQILDYFEIEE